MFFTHDLGLAAFLMINNLKLTNAYIEKSGKYCFEFDDPNNCAKQLSIDFVNSCCTKFDAQLKSLKKILRTP